MADATSSGIADAGALSDMARKTLAYNALNKMYGPAVAGNPEAALKAQEYDQNALTNPIAVEQARANLTHTGLANTGEELSNAFNAEANPLKVKGLGLANESTAATTAGTLAGTAKTVAETAQVAPEATARIGAENASAAASRAAAAKSTYDLTSDKAADARAASMGLLAGLSDVASQGGDIGAAFDKLAPQIAALENVDPAHMAPLRAKLVADPVGTINSLATAIDQANMMATGAKGGAAALNAQKYKAQQAQQVSAMKAIAQRTLAVPDTLDSAQALISGMSNLATLRKIRGEVPGTPEYKFQQLMGNVTPNLALTDLQNMKASGLSLGRVSNMEMAAAGKAYANMDLGQDKSMLAANLKRIKTVYGVVNDNLAADIKRVESGANSGGVHATAPATKATPQEIVDELRKRGAVK